jgi:hypothetical protein
MVDACVVDATYLRGKEKKARSLAQGRSIINQLTTPFAESVAGDEFLQNLKRPRPKELTPR